MSSVRRPTLVALLVLSGLALAWRPVGAYGAEDANARKAQQLVEQMRAAPSRYDFVGVATVGWRDGGRTRRAVVDVTDADGALEVRSGGSLVYDSGRRTYLSDGNRWTSVPVEPTTGELPAAGSSWTLASEKGPAVAGRPTTQVVATRRDGSVAQRLFLDDATGLLLRREVLASDGSVERSLLFTEIQLGVTAPRQQMPGDVHVQQAKPLASVPDGYRAPATVGAYALVTRSKHPDGVLLYYSDGLFSASVFEQRGDLDWGALPKGGTTTEAAGTRTRRYTEPSGEVLVWERDGVVFTCVSDAPNDVFEKMVAGFGSSGRSSLERAADYVLGPFGWN